MRRGAMRTTHYGLSFVLVAILLCLTGLELGSALSILSLAPIQGPNDVASIPQQPNPGSRRQTYNQAIAQSSSSSWRRLFRLNSSLWPSPSRPSASDSLSPWAGDRPKLVETLQSYGDQLVIRFNISDAQHEAALRSVIDRMLLDVWDFTDNHVDIRLPSRRVRYVTRALPASLRERHSVLIPDLARLAIATYPLYKSSFDTDAMRLHALGTDSQSTSDAPHRNQDVIDVFFQNYQPYSVLLAWMRLVDSMFRGRGFVKMISIGKSYEGRDIPALRVGMRPEEIAPGRRREILLVTGGAHAREWISTSSASYAAWSFIRSIDKDPLVNRILERFDLVFVPVLNPDGYEYTWEVDRLWRKSRQRTKMPYCRGLDLDHSFSYQWDSAEHQTDPCSESYGGDEPFQAVEAAQFAQWAKNETRNGFKFVGYLDLHSYSQQVLVPYSFSCTVQPPNIETLEEVAMNLAKHMRLSNGEVYSVTSACEGAVSPPTDQARSRTEARGGSAVDYVYHELGAHYSYQLKLRDTGSYGFLVPSTNIVPTGEEVFQAMKYLGDYLLGNNGHELALGDALVLNGALAQDPLYESEATAKKPRR